MADYVPVKFHNQFAPLYVCSNNVPSLSEISLAEGPCDLSFPKCVEKQVSIHSKTRLLNALLLTISRSRIRTGSLSFWVSLFPEQWRMGKKQNLHELDRMLLVSFTLILGRCAISCPAGLALRLGHFEHYFSHARISRRLTFDLFFWCDELTHGSFWQSR